MTKKDTNVKILLIDNSFGITGALESVLTQTVHLDKQFEFSYVISSNSRNKAILEKKGFQVYEIPFLELSKSWRVIFYLPKLIQNTVKLTKIIREENIKLVHINDIYNMLGVMVKIFNPLIKVVYHVRLLPSSYTSSLYSTWCFLIEKFADQIICVSTAVAKNFNSDVKIIYDTIKAPKMLERPQKSSGIKLLYLANYTKGKGHDYAVDAFEEAIKQIPGLKMQMHGSTFGLAKNRNYKDGLLNKIQGGKLADHILIDEFANDKAKVFADSDIFLNFSNSESFSMTTLEALAYGTPAIVTDCGGPSEIIEDGKSGKLVPVGDVKKMTAAIVELASNPQLRESFSRNGRKRFEEKFKLEEEAKKLETVYQSLQSTATSPQPHEAQG